MYRGHPVLRAFWHNAKRVKNIYLFCMYICMCLVRVCLRVGWSTFNQSEHNAYTFIQSMQTRCMWINIHSIGTHITRITLEAIVCTHTHIQSVCALHISINTHTLNVTRSVYTFEILHPRSSKRSAVLDSDTTSIDWIVNVIATLSVLQLVPTKEIIAYIHNNQACICWLW